MDSAPHSLPESIQDLPPEWAHFCLHAEQFINHQLGVDLTGKTVLTAFSGGVDSTALLLVMHCLCRKNNGRVVAAHLNHQLRPEADADARWAAEFCNSLGVECVTRTTDVAKVARQEEIGLEEAGRAARYTLFSDVLRTHDCNLLAVGHHLDDLAEDVLMRLVRGTGWPGLSGMTGYDAERSLIRPFLLVPKSTLVRFLTNIQVSWREDATNTDETLTRNRIRHTFLPLFLKENPNFLDSVARLWKIGSLDRNYWDEEATAAGDMVPDALLKNSHKSKRLRLYKAALDNVGQGGQALADTLFKLDAAWLDARTGAVFQFPGDRVATITHSGVVFSARH